MASHRRGGTGGAVGGGGRHRASPPGGRGGRSAPARAGGYHPRRGGARTPESFWRGGPLAESRHLGAGPGRDDTVDGRVAGTAAAGGASGCGSRFVYPAQPSGARSSNVARTSGISLKRHRRFACGRRGLGVFSVTFWSLLGRARRAASPPIARQNSTAQPRPRWRSIARPPRRTLLLLESQSDKVELGTETRKLSATSIPDFCVPTPPDWKLVYQPRASGRLSRGGGSRRSQ